MYAPLLFYVHFERLTLQIITYYMCIAELLSADESCVWEWESCAWEWLAIAELRSAQVVPVWWCLAPLYQLFPQADPTHVQLGSSLVNRQATLCL